MINTLPVLSTPKERTERAAKILACLKETYPVPKTELNYKTPFQMVAAVMLSAQCTDKMVNKVTETLYQKYTSPADFAKADLEILTKELHGITFNSAKAKHLIGAAKVVEEVFDGEVPRTEKELTLLPGIAYKSAHVVMGELFNIWEGIPTDTHVRRFALRFDLTEKTDLTKISKDLEALIPKGDWKYTNNGLVLYGRYVCKAIPHECSEHPLTKFWPPAEHRWPKAK